MIRRLLCLLGIHKWVIKNIRFCIAPASYFLTDKCDQCSKCKYYREYCCKYCGAMKR